MQIEVAFLDSDTGTTRDEITAAIVALGWCAIVASTHSHLCVTTQVKRQNWDKFRAEADDPTPAAFLEREKDYLPRVAAGAVILDESADSVTFRHQPCPKFRIAIPLQRPWRADAYPDQNTANAAWKERIEALAAALGLAHDQACTDTSRLFYLPRHPAGGTVPETAVLDGVSCDIFALLRPSGSGSGAQQEQTRHLGPADEYGFVHPETGEVIDLKVWARDYARTFEIVATLQAHRPEIFVGNVADGMKHHIRCVNEGAHTQVGDDAATIILNASASTTGGFVYHCRHAHCEGLDRLVFVRKMLEQGWLRIADLTDTGFRTNGCSPLLLIRVVAGELPAVVDQAEDALLTADRGIYQRGPFVVRPGLVRVSVAAQGDVIAQRILEVGDRALVEEMTRTAKWERYDGRSKKWIATDAPLSIAATYLQRVGRWRLPVLTGIINAPTLRPDGTILASPGYDLGTGLLLDTRGVNFPEIPSCPTRSDALMALSVLLQLIETFPFVDGASRSVALSTILTAVVRRSLATAPLHAFTAPVMGSGKSMLVDIATVIASGREAAVIAQGKSEEEREKRLGALLLAGEVVISIDNCEAPLGGEFLCQMLTQQVVRVRILGRSEVPELPTNAMVTATGNNLTFLGDMARRVMVCRLDPRCERPELRIFTVNPLLLVKNDRQRYFCAALTILRAFHVAGRPQKADPLGSFFDWSRWVRDSLIWLEQDDPVDTLEIARENDPALEALTAMLTQWWMIVGGARVSSRDIADQATQQRRGNSMTLKPEFTYPDFREALLAVAGEGGAVNTRKLSKWIGSNEDRIVGSLRIVRRGLLTGLMTWQLQNLAVRHGDDR